MCLDLDVANPTTINGRKVQLWTCNQRRQQLWKPVWVQNSPLHVRLVSLYDNRCLDADKWGPRDGAKVQVWDCNLSDQQRWWVG